MNRSPSARRHGNEGFTLVEVLIAMLILTMGILGLAQTTAFVMRQVTVSDLSDNRAAALQGAVERVRAITFDSLGDGADTVGSFIVQWTVEATSSTRSRQVTFVTTGPGLETVGGFPQLTDNVAETLVYRVNRRY